MAEFPVSLLNDPAIVSKAAKANMTPEQYLKSMRQNNMDPNIAPVLNSTEVSADMMTPPVLSDTSIVNETAPVGMSGPVDTPDVPEGFTVLKMPTGTGHSVLFNPETGETQPYTNASRQLFSNSALERDIQALARDEYGRTNISEPILTAERLAAKAQGALQAEETGENLQASLSADAALSQAMLAQENYDPSVENATVNSVQPFTDLPHGLDTFEEGYTPNPNQVTNGPVLNEPPEGFHQMPDGSMMADAEMSGGYDEVPMPPPVLESPEIRNGLTPNPSALPGAADPYAPPVGPVLEDPAAPAAKANGVLATTPTAVSGGALSSTATSLGSGPQRPTGNARGSSMAYGKIGIGEQMMRAGLKGLGASDQGMSASLGAMGQSYGETQDANRATLIAKEKADEATRIANARQAGLNAKALASAKKAKGGPPTAVYKTATLSAITRIKGLLDAESGANPFDNVSGWTGSLLSSVPGTPAHDVFNSINTIEAAVGFDRLQKMRDDSPTGGALGQVTERELALLSQSLGSLKQSSSREQFVANLNAVEKHYQAAVDAVEAQQAEYYKLNGGTIPTAANTADQAPAASNGGYTIKMKE